MWWDKTQKTSIFYKEESGSAGFISKKKNLINLVLRPETPTL